MLIPENVNMMPNKNPMRNSEAKPDMRPGIPQPQSMPDMMPAMPQPSAPPPVKPAMPVQPSPPCMKPAMPYQPAKPMMPSMPQPAAKPGMMPAMPHSAAKPAMEAAKAYKATYPEIYYKLLPYVIFACDQIFSFGCQLPTQQQLEEIADAIFDEFCKTCPDMAVYMGSSMKDDPPGDPPRFRGGFRGGPAPFFFGGFRRRGLGRDFIEALLLSELLGRGGVFF